jgi:hypothetical protein
MHVADDVVLVVVGYLDIDITAMSTATHRQLLQSISFASMHGAPAVTAGEKWGEGRHLKGTKFRGV